MNDIEKKMEALKAEFLGKLEELQKEAEAQKKQEALKPWKHGGLDALEEVSPNE